MNDKRIKLIEDLVKATVNEDKELTIKITQSLLQEFSFGIGQALNPISVFEIPFAISALERYSAYLRETFPEACQTADDLKAIPHAFVRIPAAGGNDK